MIRSSRWLWLVVFSSGFGPFIALGQIDPLNRELFQIGYNQALEGHQPLSGYAFYYLNRPEFLHTNWTLRLALAPTYLDSELGFRNALGQNTDLGLGLAGGGFADNYVEIRSGKYLPKESFIGHSGELALSVYHLFNPDQKIPLYWVLRGIAHYSFYDRDSDTANDFRIPDNRGTFSVRTGLRLAGREPTLFPSVAMELSIWYQGEFRTSADTYGFDDRRVSAHSHLFWAEALLAYTMPKLKHTFYISLTAGTSIDADRFSAYRLGALLPLVSEFPLSLPGYYYQEISAEKFVLLGGNYLIPLDHRQRWNLNVTATTASVDYLDGLEQPGNWHSGVGGGLLYRSPSWKIMLGYGYGIDAIRSHGRGAHSVGLLLQLDLERALATLPYPEEPGLWRGWQRIFSIFGS